MNAVNSYIGRAINYLFSIGVSDVIDILIVAVLIYEAMKLIRRTNAYNIAKGFMLFLVILWVSDLAGLTMINFILRKATELGLILLVVLFQPELRRVLEKVGSSFSSARSESVTATETAIAQTVVACSDMSASKTGALIIFERNVRLSSIIATGTVIDAEVSAELLKNIFFNKAPLHDGAVIIRDGRVAAAGCVLPLTSNPNLNKELGMRHRAGIGMSENSDAVVMIVSEETGAISCSIDGTLKRHLSAPTVDRLLRKELLVDDTAEKKNSLKVLIERLKNSGKGEYGDDEKNI